jgi:hypothetical protein
MSSRIFTYCILASIASAGAFTCTTSKKSNTRLFYRDNLDDSFTQRQLPSGAFGILPSPITAMNQDTTTLDEKLHYNSTFREIEPEPLISASIPTQSSHIPSIDLPSSARTRTAGKSIDFTEAIELSIGRVAMMAALVSFSMEIFTGQSLPQQFLSLIGQL